jgi:hypothetical protein
MGPGRRLSVPHHNQIRGILMVLRHIIDSLCPLKTIGKSLQEAISGILGNTLNNHISPRTNILEKFYKEHLRIWMLNENMAALLMMTDLRIRIVGMATIDVKCRHNLIRRNGRGTLAIGPKRAA